MSARQTVGPEDDARRADKAIIGVVNATLIGWLATYMLLLTVVLYALRHVAHGSAWNAVVAAGSLPMWWFIAAMVAFDARYYWLVIQWGDACDLTQGSDLTGRRWLSPVLAAVAAAVALALGLLL